jgi:hypothetical protein
LTFRQYTVIFTLVTRGLIGGRAALLALALFTGLVLAPVAGADLKPGSRHAFLVGAGKHKRLALPLPRALATPKLTRDGQGRIRVVLKVRFAVANWTVQKGVRHDRALVTMIVSRRLFTTGPDPSTPLYRHTFVDLRGLSRRLIDRSYEFLLPKSVSKFLVSKGVFASGGRRRVARRLVWIDVQQDRDLKRVDGRYDWREGMAFGAADKIRPPRSGVAFTAASEANPYGTLSITNNTGAGVYCKGSQCPLVNSSTGLPGTISGTMNSSTYGVPLAVNGGAVQCFDQGTNGSDPAGFANDNAAGAPQPYSSGTASAAFGGSTLPNTTGTTVTEGIAADYSLAWAGNQQTASATGAIMGGVKLGLQVIKGVAQGVLFVSPGAIITGILGIFEYFLENSCKESGNYFNITAAETKGAAVSSTYDANTSQFYYYPGSGSTPPGLQLNPSGLKLNGSRLWLNTDVAIATGLHTNDCLCTRSVGNNAIELNWNNYDPCIASPAAECSLPPPESPVVTSGTGNINCGTSNTRCPFPAAGWPPTNGVQQIYAGLSGGSTGVLWSCNPFYHSNCTSAYLDSHTGQINAMTGGNNAIYMGDNDGYLFACATSISGVCNQTYSFGSRDPVTALATFPGNGMFVAVYDESGINAGELDDCNANLSGSASCSRSYSFPNGTQINGMASANGGVEAGGSNGVLYYCSNSTSGGCTTSFTFPNGTGVDSVTVAYGQVWAGLSNGTLWTCTIAGTSCSPWDTLPNQGQSSAPAITSLTAGPNHTVYLGAPIKNEPLDTGVWQCSTGGANSCSAISETSTVTSLVYANGFLYYGTSDGGYLQQCAPTGNSGSCTQLDTGSVSSQYISALVAGPPAK